MPDRAYYYLTAEEVQHYQYMMDHGYSCKTINTGRQEYVVFAMAARPEVGIAWPTVDGKIGAVSKSADTVFDFYEPLHFALVEHLKGSTIQIILAPRYVD